MTAREFGRRFIGRSVLITGAARGIGKTIALWFAGEGAYVAANDIKKADLEATVQELKRHGEKVEGYVCDVSKAEEVRRMVDAVLRDFGKIDILVNNAGVALRTRVLDLSEEERDRVLDVNLESAFIVSQSVLKHMTSRAYGRIIMISSIAGKTGDVATGLHCDVSKAGLIVMARRLAREFGPLRVTVNAVAPSFVQTDMLKDLELDSPEKRRETINVNGGRLED